MNSPISYESEMTELQHSSTTSPTTPTTPSTGVFSASSSELCSLRSSSSVFPSCELASLSSSSSSSPSSSSSYSSSADSEIDRSKSIDNCPEPNTNNGRIANKRGEYLIGGEADVNRTGDVYRLLIQEMLQSDSVLDSLNSAKAQNRSPSKPTQTESAFIGELEEFVSSSPRRSGQFDTIVANKSAQLATYDCERVQQQIKSNQRSNGRTFCDVVHDYSHRLTRYIKWHDVLFLTVTFVGAILIYRFLLVNSLSVLQMSSIWIVCVLYYFAIPIFRRWFYYWDPTLTFTRPS